MGNELKRDFCPEKYCAQETVFVESLPVLFAVVVVAFFSGNLFDAGGMHLAITILMEIVFAGALYGFSFFLFRGMKKRLSETYLSVCEKGVCGICPKNGYQNREFSLLYAAIDKVDVKGERLFVYSKKGNVVLTLKDAQGTATLIRTRMTEH